MPDSSSARDTVSQYLSMREMREKENVLVGAVKVKLKKERDAIAKVAPPLGSFHLVKK